jgi:Cytochrome P460
MVQALPRRDTVSMKTQTLVFTAASLLLGSVALCQSTATGNHSPNYTEDGRLGFPEDYRSWIYLTTGFDMSYSAGMRMGHHMFDNVFVQPEAYKVFLDTGKWPEKTMLIIEARGARDKGSINKSGNYQSTDVMGYEIHVKDSARFQDGWAFFGFNDKNAAQMVPRSADCYSCHRDHAAVDTTFVQFYPTLLPIAAAKGTLSESYQRELEKTPQ